MQTEKNNPSFHFPEQKEGIGGKSGKKRKEKDGGENTAESRPHPMRGKKRGIFQKALSQQMVDF